MGLLDGLFGAATGGALSGLLQPSFTKALSNVYAQVHKQAFPINTSLLQRAGLQEIQLGSLVPVYPGKLHFVDTRKPTVCPCGKCVLKSEFNKDTVVVYQSAECWLTERVEKVILLGRNWSRGSIKRLDGLARATELKYQPAYKSPPPAVGGQRMPLRVDSEANGIPVRYIRPGDALFAYDQMPEGFKEWLQKAQTSE